MSACAIDVTVQTVNQQVTVQPNPWQGTASPTGALSQAQADARYIQKTAINSANGVPGLDASSFMTESQLPLPPITLTVLLANKLA